ncbi:MAG: hypothetical protein HY280_09810 [Nitrospinae bacterium]|nr:hypothetical protein [Nitrospinota bacterium]
MPGFGSFGSFLVERGVITEAQLRGAVAIQDKERLLGKLAVEDGYLANNDVAKISDYQALHAGVKFGRFRSDRC